jgi:hypothetical protein
MVQRLAAVAFVGSCAWLVAAGMARAQTCPAPGVATTPCTGSCAAITAPMASGAKGGAVSIPITFSQGPDNSQANSGFDDVAAIAFTLGAPGTGTGTPLTFNCTGGNLAAGAFQAGSGDFTVVIENAQCTGRDHCLCPTEGTQTRDNFVNVVAYGPKNLPEQGPVQIPRLPNTGVLVTLTMQIAGDAPDTIPLRVFSAMDNDKPTFGANLSIGDQSACDVTATQSKSNVLFTAGSVTTTGTATPCVGDCNNDHMVLINELIIGVNMALTTQPITTCPAFNPNNDNQVLINELIQGVNNALTGCPPQG